MVRIFYVLAATLFLLVFGAAFFWPPVLWSLVVLVPLFLLGVRDSLQTRRAVLRNFPLIGHFRYLFEMIRPEISQYFIESNTDGTPFNRELRSLVYQRAKKQRDTIPFGTQRDVYEEGYEWMDHSVKAFHPDDEAPRIRIGSPECTQPYEASLLNISAMSFGSLSAPAILALNEGAKRGGFYHNTGEGGVSPYHLRPGGDLVWQVGTGYFGCRASDGGFDAGRFSETVQAPAIKMIELKLSQGAKPGHGGILPAVKITPEIAAIRGVEMGFDVNSPPRHSAFDTPRGLVQFIADLRERAGGRPVGIKLCIGSPTEFISICKAIHEEGVGPDFISIDGCEGGTGAAPLEFSNSIGWPLTEGLIFAHNCLVGFGLREQIKIIAAGKIISGFDMAKRLAVGADIINSARGMMFALGCIQARRCNSNECPVGVATQKPELVRGLVAESKSGRVHHFHEASVQALRDLLGAAGLKHPDDLRPWHIYRRVSPSLVMNYAQIYTFLEPGSLLEKVRPADYDALCAASSADAF